MKEQAIAKLKAEMDGNLNNGYIQYIGGYLTQIVEMNPSAAEKIMAADKTLAKSLDAMRKEAEKKKTGNFAMLTPTEGIAVVFDYFGIKGAAATPVIAPPTPAVQAPVPAATPTPVASGSGFNVSLEEFGL